ncbi:MAG: gas vesicle protein GvpD P-loop domain-containing protein [Candidatus Thermoplasmatota archaeon]
MGEEVKEIPEEILQFFKVGGHTFLIKGKSGVGKTKFSLQLIERLNATDRLAYISPYPSKEPLYPAFPWLREFEKKVEVKDQEHEIDKPMSAKELLKAIMEEKFVRKKGIEGSGLLKLFEKKEKIPTDLRKMYGYIGNIKMPYIIINKIEKYAEKNEIKIKPFVKALQNDFTTNEGNILLVSEKVSDYLDDIADGIVTLKEFSIGREYVGQMELNKLQGIEIGEHRYLFHFVGEKIQFLNGKYPLR